MGSGIAQTYAVAGFSVTMNAQELDLRQLRKRSIERLADAVIKHVDVNGILAMDTVVLVQ